MTRLAVALGVLALCAVWYGAGFRAGVESAARAVTPVSDTVAAVQAAELHLATRAQRIEEAANRIERSLGVRP